MFNLRSKKKKNSMQPVARKLVTISEPKSVVLEQFRTIRTNIKFSMPDEQLQTILITSSTPGEGKSTNAANLGVVFAQEGKRVLIIDGDMRKPTLHHTFKTFNKVGLSSILARKAAMHEAVQETFIVGLDVITSGPIPPNPSELLSARTMDILLLEVKKDYDIIIVDSPPLLSVSDAQILGSKCDGSILILNTGNVDKRAVKKAKSILDSSQTKILGVVMNNYKLPTHHYYYDYENYSLAD
ncbi:CpsD/CapB family tyrosine-protein kinase [Solibacillus sp. FSL K6-4121]|uniref:CpsD/CapB family tyrosine-protein kinase n=1 Tax=Solibacillus sp. FSL K6-4121 TaxID=2921505 RepID=UPI0030F522D6